MTSWHIALGDRQKAGQPGLGSDQVIITFIEQLLMRAQADMKKVPLGTIKSAEIHRHKQTLTAVGKLVERCRLNRRCVVSMRKLTTGLRRCQQVTRQIATIYSRHIGGGKHFQRACFIPVQQMAMVLGQLINRA